MTSDQNEDLAIAIEALEQLKQGSPDIASISTSSSSTNIAGTGTNTTHTSPPQDSFLEKVTAHPLISNSLNYMLEKTLTQATNYVDATPVIEQPVLAPTNERKRSLDNEELSFKRPKLTPSSSNLQKILPPLRHDTTDLAAQRRALLDIKELGIMNLSIESRKKLTMLINFLKIGNKQLSSRIDSLMELCSKNATDDEFMDAASQISRTRTNSVESVTAISSTEDAKTEDANETTVETESNVSAEDDMFVQQLKQEIIGTVKKIVNVVSKFSGNSLPEPARSNVREVLLKLPVNWATALGQEDDQDQQRQEKKKTEKKKGILSNLYKIYLQKKPDPNERVLILAQESLDMIQKVIKFCYDSLDKAENWNLEKQNEQQSKLLNKLETMSSHSSAHKEDE